MDYDEIIFGMIIMVVLICIFAFGYLWGLETNDKEPKIITSYETRTCTIYSDETEDCEIESRG